MSSVARTSVALFLLFAGLYLLTTRGNRQSVDDVPRYNLTERLVMQRTISIPEGSLMASRTHVEGRVYSKYGIGMSLFMVPAFLKGKVIDRIAPEGLRAAMGDPAVWMMSAVNQVLGALAVALLFLIVRRVGYGDRTALFVALSAGLASMLWIYSQTSFENVLVLVLLEFILLAFLGAGPLGVGAAFGAGCATGYIFLTRWGDGWIFLPGVAALGAARLLNQERSRRLLAPISAFAIPAVAGVGLAMLYNYARFLDPLELGYDDDNISAHYLHRGLFGFLFSPAKSVFVFTPLLVLGVAGFARLWRRLGGGLLAAGWFWLIGAPLFVYAMFENWHGGWCFGPRYLLPSVVLATVALGEWFQDPRWSTRLGRPGLFGLLFIIGFYAQIVCLGSDFNTYSNVAHDFRFMPDSCPLLALPRGRIYQPGQNLWFIGLLFTPGLSAYTKAFVLLPLAFLGAGAFLLRRELGSICTSTRDRLSQPSPALAKTLLGALAILAAIMLMEAAGAARRALPAPKGAGLKASWFANTRWSPPTVKTEVHPRIDFDFSRKNRPVPLGFSVRWEGFIDAGTSGTYFFGLDACGTTTLWLDEKPVIFHYGEPRGRRLAVISLPLDKGRHPIRLDYASALAWDDYEVNGRGYRFPRHLPFGLTLRWKPPGAPWLRTVPARALRPE